MSSRRGPPARNHRRRLRVPSPGAPHTRPWPLSRVPRRGRAAPSPFTDASVFQPGGSHRVGCSGEDGGHRREAHCVGSQGAWRVCRQHARRGRDTCQSGMFDTETFMRLEPTRLCTPTVRFLDSGLTRACQLRRHTCPRVTHLPQV